MSEDVPRIVDIKSWVDRARRDPAVYVERQATEIVLSTIGSLPGYGSRIFLKGGILMAVVYRSPRGTADIDFTTDLAPSPELPIELRAAQQGIATYGSSARLSRPGFASADSQRTAKAVQDGRHSVSGLVCDDRVREAREQGGAAYPEWTGPACD